MNWAVSIRARSFSAGRVCVSISVFFRHFLNARRGGSKSGAKMCTIPRFRDTHARVHETLQRLPTAARSTSVSPSPFLPLPVSQSLLLVATTVATIPLHMEWTELSFIEPLAWSRIGEEAFAFRKFHLTSGADKLAFHFPLLFASGWLIPVCVCV